MTNSVKLVQDDKHREALRVWAKAAVDAIQREEFSWILTLSHHAAAIASFIGEPQLVKHYDEQSLAFVPENPRALYGLLVNKGKSRSPATTRVDVTRPFAQKTIMTL